MRKELIIQKIIGFVREKLGVSESGHDYWHALRVLKNVRKIAEDYSNINVLVIEAAALVHDIVDHKFEDVNILGLDSITDFLRSLDFTELDIDFVVELINNVSFSAEKNDSIWSVELEILQDADRLDALGAIGIARAFSYGGFKKREFYNPEIKPKLNMSKEEYRKSKSTTINHFYEKLFLLKDEMNTPKGKELAEERHQFMLDFVEKFKKEWGD